MALVNCPQCGKEISDRGEICPYCKTWLKKNDPMIFKCSKTMTPKYLEKRSQTVSPSQSLTKDGTVIHCPTCGSADIERISNISKAVNIWAWGIFGSKHNKQFKCNNCKYMW